MSASTNGGDSMQERPKQEILWCILKRPLLAEEWTVCLRFSTCVEAAHALSHSRPEFGYEYAIVERPWNKQIDPERVAAATRVVKTLQTLRGGV